jgi:hypothetical protein
MDFNDAEEVRSSSSTTSQERSAIEVLVTLYQNDCVSAPDASLAFINSTTGDELDVELDIIQKPFQTPSTTSTSTVQPPSSDSASA